MNLVPLRHCAMALRYDGNSFDGAVIPGRPPVPAALDHDEAMRGALSQPATPSPSPPKCELLLLISSAAGYERRRKAVRESYLSRLRERAADIGVAVRYRFLLGAPRPEQAHTLDAEHAQHGDLLQVAVPESYETLWPKIVAAWRWALATHDFTWWMHADDDSFVRCAAHGPESADRQVRPHPLRALALSRQKFEAPTLSPTPETEKQWSPSLSLPPLSLPPLSRQPLSRQPLSPTSLSLTGSSSSSSGYACRSPPPSTPATSGTAPTGVVLAPCVTLLPNPTCQQSTGLTTSTRPSHLAAAT